MTPQNYDPMQIFKQPISLHNTKAQAVGNRSLMVARTLKPSRYVVRKKVAGCKRWKRMHARFAGCCAAEQQQLLCRAWSMSGHASLSTGFISPLARAPQLFPDSPSSPWEF